MIPAIVIEHSDARRSVFTPSGQFPWAFPPHTRQSNHCIRVDGEIVRQIVARDAETEEELQNVLETLCESEDAVRTARTHSGQRVKVFMFV
jgi:hypothetical protein